MNSSSRYTQAALPPASACNCYSTLLPHENERPSAPTKPAALPCSQRGAQPPRSSSRAHAHFATWDGQSIILFFSFSPFLSYATSYHFCLVHPSFPSFLLFFYFLQNGIVHTVLTTCVYSLWTNLEKYLCQDRGIWFLFDGFTIFRDLDAIPSCL